MRLPSLAPGPGSLQDADEERVAFCARLSWGHALVQGHREAEGAAAVSCQVQVEPACVGTDLEPHLRIAC